MKNNFDGGKTRSLEWLAKNLPPKRDLNPVELDDLEIEIGGIYRAVTPDSYQLDSSLSGSRMIVLVTRIHAEYAEICLFHEDEDWMTDKDIFLESDDSGSIHPLVLQTDMVGVIWHYQLQHPDGTGYMRLGKVHQKILDSIKSVRDGDCPNSLIHKIGLGLEVSDTSLWKFKENQVDEINFLSSDCTQALLAGEGYFDKFVNKDLKAELYETVGRKPIITSKAEFKEGRRPFGRSDLINDVIHGKPERLKLKSKRIAYADPAILHYPAEYYEDPENLHEVLGILSVAKLPLNEVSHLQSFLENLPPKSRKMASDIIRFQRKKTPTPQYFSSQPFDLVIGEKSREVLNV